MNKQRLAGSSVIEVIVAMVLIVIVFGLGLMIYTNVIKFSLSTKKIKAGFIVQQLLIKEESNTQITDQHLQAGEFTITEQVSEFNNNDKLLSVHITAFDSNNEQVAEVQKIILKNAQQ